MRRPVLVRGIRDKLIVAFSALVAAIALFVFVFFPERLERQAMRATMAKASAIGEMATYSLAAGLVFDDSVAVGEVVTGASKARDVSFLTVWDEHGRLIATRGKGAPRILPVAMSEGTISADGGTIVTTMPIVSGATRVGMLSLGVSLAPLRADVAQSRRLGALVGILILGIGICAIFAISTFVTRPLTAVAQTVDRIAAGDLTSRAAESNDVEVRHLVRAFNHMIDTLVGTQAELALMNETLEGRVESRTAELTQAIAEQRQSQAALVHSENAARQTSELLQSFIDVAPQAIVAVDLEWNVTRWNLAATRLFGWSASEVVGKEVPFIPDGQRDGFRRQQEVLRTVQAPEMKEVIRIHKDGSRLDLLLAASNYRDREHVVVGFVGIFTDLTERKRLEEQLRQSQKMQAMGRLAGGVAHDFNNILTVITACTELLLADAQDPDEREQLELIAGAAARATSLTRQLLTFTRQQIVQVVSVDVGGVVREIEPMLRRVLPANIRLTTRLSREESFIDVDRSQLEQVVMNLVVNAADAMPDGGELDVHLSRVQLGESAASQLGIAPGRHCRLVVRDSGVGIDETTIARIFEPFFTTKELGKGTGLGLATTYGIVTAMGGAIGVHSVPGKGTTFELHLPETAVRAPVPSVDVTNFTDGGSEKSQSTILLVEDEQLVRQVVRRSLERSGYRVIEAVDGEQGLAMTAEHGHTLCAVVTDMMMPGMSGREFATRLNVSHPHLGIVCISGYTDSGPEDGPILDANHVFLQKPFTRAQILAAIESVARDPIANRPTPEAQLA